MLLMGYGFLAPRFFGVLTGQLGKVGTALQGLVDAVDAGLPGGLFLGSALLGHTEEE